MADNKSCEGKMTTLECMRCGHRETFTERQFKTTDGLSCEVCKGPIIPVITRKGEKVSNRRMRAKKIKQIGYETERTGNAIGKAMTKIDIDVSDALKGLKAVQREAKKAARALKDAEQSQSYVMNVTINCADGNPDEIAKKFNEAIRNSFKHY